MLVKETFSDVKIFFDNNLLFFNIKFECRNKRENYSYNFQHLKNNGGILTTTDSLICNFTNNAEQELSKQYLQFLKDEKTI